jgi:ankyrin repeat protein
MVQALLAAGARVRDRNPESGREPLHWAAGWGSDETVRVLLAAGARADAADAAGLLPLHLAARYKRLASFQALLAAGSPVEAEGSFEKSRVRPLHMALEGGCWPCARALIAAGANVNAAGADGPSPALVVLMGGEPEGPGSDDLIDVLQRLLQAGARLDMGTPRFSGALDAAARRGRTRAMPLLLQAGARFEREVLDGKPLLQRATNDWYISSESYLGLLQAMQAAGVDFEARDAEGKSAVDRIAKPSSSTGRMLQTWVRVGRALRQGDAAGVLGEALAKGQAEELKVCLARGVDANAVDDDGNPLLHAAVRSGRTSFVSALLAAGAKPDARDELFRRTALHVAAGRPNAEDVLQALLKRGAAVDARDRTGRTALELARTAGIPANVQVLEQAQAAMAQAGK